MKYYIALFGLVGMTFMMGSNLAFWRCRKQPIDRRLACWHGLLIAACLWTVVAGLAQ